MPSYQQLPLFAEPPPVIPPETTAVLAAPTALIASVSGGVDSDYAAWWLRDQYPDRPIILWHAYLEEDWPQTPAHLDTLAAILGDCRRVTVQAVYELNGQVTPGGFAGTTLRRLHDVEQHGPAQDNDPLAITNLLQLTSKARGNLPPTASTRFCTAYLKGRALGVWARTHRQELGARPLLVSGERWAESPKRAALPPWQWRAEITLKPCDEWPQGWQMLWLRPGVKLKLHEVVAKTTGAGIPLHPAYALQGETLAAMRDPQRDERGRARVSCRVCIFSHPRHIATALTNDPTTMYPAVEAIQHWEQATGKTWQQRGPLLLPAPTDDQP